MQHYERNTFSEAESPYYVRMKKSVGEGFARKMPYSVERDQYIGNIIIINIFIVSLQIAKGS